MIKTAVKISVEGSNKKKSYIESKIDRSASSSDSLQFKQFKDGNHLFIESTGLDANRIHGFTADGMFFDECFPYDQNIETETGKIKIGKIYEDFIKNKNIPLVKTFNEKKETFEYKQITNAWKKNRKSLIQITCEKIKIKCSENQRFLTNLCPCLSLRALRLCVIKD